MTPTSHNIWLRSLILLDASLRAMPGQPLDDRVRLLLYICLSATGQRARRALQLDGIEKAETRTPHKGNVRKTKSL